MSNKYIISIIKTAKMGGFDVINWFEKIVMHQTFLKHCKKRAITGFVIGAESDTLFTNT